MSTSSCVMPRPRRSSSCSSSSSSAPPAICRTSSSRVDLALRVVADHPAAVEEHEAVADREGVVRVVGDEDHADAALARLEDVLEHDARLLDAERRGRLVEDQHARAEVDRPRDRDRLPLAARERADRLVRVADVDPHLAQLARARSSSPARRRTARNGPQPFVGSAPRKKFRQIDISGTIARSW